MAGAMAKWIQTATLKPSGFCNIGVIMADSKEVKPLIDQAAEDLFNYAVEREDIKLLMAQLAPAARAATATIEYELQILKIISVGWSISYHLSGLPKRKNKIGGLFWQSVNNFSGQISETTGLMIGRDIDYFEILKKRLDQYVNAMEVNAQASEPAGVIGPVFAGLCGHEDDIFTIMAGSKMFANAVTRVRQYLEAAKLR